MHTKKPLLFVLAALISFVVGAQNVNWAKLLEEVPHEQSSGRKAALDEKEALWKQVDQMKGNDRVDCVRSLAAFCGDPAHRSSCSFYDFLRVLGEPSNPRISFDELLTLYDDPNRLLRRILLVWMKEGYLEGPLTSSQLLIMARKLDVDVMDVTNEEDLRQAALKCNWQRVLPRLKAELATAAPADKEIQLQLDQSTTNLHAILVKPNQSEKLVRQSLLVARDARNADVFNEKNWDMLKEEFHKIAADETYGFEDRTLAQELSNR